MVRIFRKICHLFSQTLNLGEPYDRCKAEAEPVATCLQRCNQRYAENKCGCQDDLDGFQNNGSLPDCDVFGMLCIIKTRGRILT